MAATILQAMEQYPVVADTLFSVKVETILYSIN